MAEDPKHPWGSGATSYRYAPEIRAIVQQVERRFPRAAANTYTCHPWCGWSQWSVDWWDSGGRGDSLPAWLGAAIRSYLMDLPGEPYIRHTILDNTIWTSWGGYSYWSRNDHTDALRHLHVTWYPS